MNNTNTGGPAFPQTEVDRDGVTVTHQSGMTLRDYFAAKAMPSMIEPFSFGDADPIDYCEAIAKSCYALSDAMLKAREA
jgi:hypothetical protein